MLLLLCFFVFLLKFSILNHVLELARPLQNLSVLDLRFSNWWLWRVQSSGLQCHVIPRQPYLSEKCITFILRDEDQAKQETRRRQQAELLSCSDPVDEANAFLQIVGLFPNYPQKTVYSVYVQLLLYFPNGLFLCCSTFMLLETT